MRIGQQAVHCPLPLPVAGGDLAGSVTLICVCVSSSVAFNNYWTKLTSPFSKDTVVNWCAAYLSVLPVACILHWKMRNMIGCLSLFID